MMTRRLHSVIASGLTAIGVCMATLLNASLSDETEFHYNADLKVAYVDNLFLSSNTDREDLFMVFSPGIELTAEEKGAASYSIGYTHHFTAYNDYSGLNDNFPDLKARVSYDSGISLINVRASYKQWASNTIEVTEEENLIDWDNTSVGGDVRYELTDLTAFKIGIDYSELNYDSKQYTDQEVLSVPAGFFYRIRPRMELTGGVRLRNVNNSSNHGIAFDYKDVFYYGGVVGELFSPKLYADVKVGYQTRDYENFKRDESSPTYDISLVYAASVKSSAYLTFSQDFRSSANGGLSYTSTNFTLGGQFSLTESIDFNGALVFGENSYDISPREEDLRIINLGTSYRPNDNFSLSANYSYTEVDGNGKAWAQDYDKNQFSVTASVRY